jgi:hypothetical protein
MHPCQHVSWRTRQDRHIFVQPLGKDSCRNDSERSGASQSTIAPPLRNYDGRGCPDFLSGTTSSAPGGLLGANKPEGSSLGNMFVEPVDVGSALAGELKYGRQVAVSSQVTGHGYAYEYSSEPSILCLSEGMKFLGLSDVQKEDEEEVQECINNEVVQQSFRIYFQNSY